MHFSVWYGTTVLTVQIECKY